MKTALEIMHKDWSRELRQLCESVAHSRQDSPVIADLRPDFRHDLYVALEDIVSIYCAGLRSAIGATAALPSPIALAKFLFHNPGQCNEVLEHFERQIAFFMNHQDSDNTAHS